MGLSKAPAVGGLQAERKSYHLNIVSLCLAGSLIYESSNDFNYTLHKMV